MTARPHDASVADARPAAAPDSVPAPAAVPTPGAFVDGADLADLVVTIARDLNHGDPTDAGFRPLSAVDVTVLRWVHRNPGHAPSEIAVATGLQRSNLSVVLRRLEEQQLVARSHATGDGRAVRVDPTQRTAERYERLRARWGELMGVDDADPRLAPALDLLEEAATRLEARRRSGSGDKS